MRTLIFALLLFASSAMAQKSITLSGTTGSVTASSTASNDFTWSFRLHNWAAPGTTKTLFSSPGVTVRLLTTSNVCVLNNLDTMPDYGNEACTDITGHSDVTIIAVRDRTAMAFYLLAWDTQTGSSIAVRCNQAPGHPDPCPIGTLNTGNWGSSSVSINPGTVTAQFAWLKWTTGILSSMPIQGTTANLANYKFESNGTDAARGDNIAFTGATYPDTPNYAPVAVPRTQNAPSWTSIYSVRAGVPVTLDGSHSVSVNEPSTLTYLWTTTDDITIQNPTSATPVIRGLKKGEYHINLKVTDSYSLTHTASLRLGAVATDSNGIVSTGSGAVQQILGSQIAFGRNPWEWADSRHERLANFFGALLDTDYAPYWRSFKTGTVQVTNGSTTVTGTGTNFASVMTCGAEQDGIVVRYPSTDPAGGYQYVAYATTACDTTSLTLNGAWDLASGSGLSWAVWTQADLGRWANQSTNPNYYDNVLAHYSLYYATGDTRYRDFARTLADYWYEQPFVNRLTSDVPHAVRMNAAPRMWGITGLVLRALDGRPELWEGINRNLGYVVAAAGNTAPIDDLREEGLVLEQLALGAMYAPDSGDRNTYKAKLEALITNKWTTYRGSNDGSINANVWKIRGLLPGGPYPSSSTLSVTNGQATVTGTGIPSNFCTGTWIIFGTSPSTFDDRVYRCERDSSTQLRLRNADNTADVNYAGTTSATKAYDVRNLVGSGIQPFMLGIDGTSFRYAQDATAIDLSSWRASVMDWIKDYGSHASTKGIYYGRIFPPCDPTKNGGASLDSIPECVGTDGAMANRSYAGEVFGACSSAYSATANAGHKTRCDELYTVNFGKAGFGLPAGITNADGYYNTDLDNGGWVETTKKAKDFAFFCGFGFCRQWPAVRLGGLAASDMKDVKISMNRPVAATSTVVTVTAPNGSTTEYTLSTLPGTIQIDRSLGTEGFATFEHRSSGVVLARGRVRF